MTATNMQQKILSKKPAVYRIDADITSNNNNLHINTQMAASHMQQ